VAARNPDEQSPLGKGLAPRGDHLHGGAEIKRRPSFRDQGPEPGLSSILGMLLEPEEPAQASFCWHHRGRSFAPAKDGNLASQPQSVMPRAPRAVRGFGRSDSRSDSRSDRRAPETRSRTLWAIFAQM